MTSSPWWSKIPGSNRALAGFSLARSSLYLAESYPLQLLNRWLSQKWSPEDSPPDDFNKAAFEAGVTLLKNDAERACTGLFPLKLLRPELPHQHLKSLIGVLADGIRVAWRMKNKNHSDLAKADPQDLENLPEYYLRNFHYQTDGYLSEASAARYDHQVEILFKGGASAMRRLALVPIEKFIHEKSENKNGQSTIMRALEIGAGAGSATEQVALSFPDLRITATDLSKNYLKFAQSKLKSISNVDYLMADCTQLPFKDNSFDICFSVFMFHEMPKEERLKAIKEAERCLKPEGLLVIVDSLQWDDSPNLNWGLERFPQDFHEPFYKNYVQNPLEDQIKEAGLEMVHTELGLLSKCIAARKPQKMGLKKSVRRK